MAYDTNKSTGTGDAHAQIARLREQVEALMRDRVTPALTKAAGRAKSAFHPGGHCARSGRERFRQGPRPALRGDPDRGSRGLRARPGVALTHASPPPGAYCAEAEGLRLRYSFRRAVTCAVLGLIALSFLFGALVFGHIAAWYWLRTSFDRPAAALIVAGAELVVALALAMLATRSSPGRIEAEALAVRRRALESATSSLAFSALLTQLLPLAIRLFRRRG